MGGAVIRVGSVGVVCVCVCVCVVVRVGARVRVCVCVGMGVGVWGVCIRTYKQLLLISQCTFWSSE